MDYRILTLSLLSVVLLFAIFFVACNKEEERFTAVCDQDGCLVYESDIVPESMNCRKFVTHYEGKVIPGWRC